MADTCNLSVTQLDGAKMVTNQMPGFWHQDSFTTKEAIREKFVAQLKCMDQLTFRNAK